MIALAAAQVDTSRQAALDYIGQVRGDPNMLAQRGRRPGGASSGAAKRTDSRVTFTMPTAICRRRSPRPSRATAAGLGQQGEWSA
jgi:hypothetical protein